MKFGMPTSAPPPAPPARHRSIGREISEQGFADAVLSAWAVVLQAYYHEDPTPLCVVRDEEPGATHRVESVNVSIPSDVKSDELCSLVHRAAKVARPAQGATKAIYITRKMEQAGSLAVKLNLNEMIAVGSGTDGVVATIHSASTEPHDFALDTILDSFLKVLENIVDHPAQPVCEIELLSDRDLAHLRHWVTAPMILEKPPTIPSLIVRFYTETPSQTAISTTQGDKTYAELGQQSATIAAALRTHGVRPGNVVGFCLDKSAFALVVLVGILRAGAAYLPIDPSYPAARVSEMLQRAKAQLLLAQRETRERLCDAQLSCPVLDPETLRQEVPVPARWHEETAADGSGICYIMFTSGSTGHPKGVVQGNAEVASGLLEVVKALNLGPTTRFLQYATFAFDASILELFGALVAGGTVCIPSAEERLGPALEQTMNQLRVTDATLTPVVVKLLNPKHLHCLRNVSVGGEAPTRSMVEAWRGHARLSNIYGSTEAGVWDTFQPGITASDNVKNIGRGMGTSCWIVHPENVDRLQPVGVEGELVLQSPYLARGYLDDPDQQAAAFIPAPRWIRQFHLGMHLHQRFFRTGDLVRQGADGSIVYVGRKGAGFVKIRGQRVDIHEVETGIGVCLHGARVGVIASDAYEDQIDRELVAYIERQPSTPQWTTNELRAQLARQLPPYMIPTIFVPIEQIPLTLSGKIDRQALRALFSQLALREKVALRAGTSSTAQWAQIDPSRTLTLDLSNEIVDLVESKQTEGAGFLRGRDFPLSTLGLSSIDLAYLSGVIRRRWDKQVSLNRMQAPGTTVGDLAALIETHSTSTGDVHHVDLGRELGLLKLKLPRAPGLPNGQLCVFLTSITGFLGTQILRTLLCHPQVGRIIGLVRAKDQAEGWRRVRADAETGGWWRDDITDRLQIWLGDISQPHLGLGAREWDCLRGHSGPRIHSIIHNAARVNWVESFDALKAANVDCILDLVAAVAGMETPSRMTYVTGGYVPAVDETSEEIRGKLQGASGYDQTKFLALLAMTEYNDRLDRAGNRTAPRVVTVHPGFIVGSREEGVAHTEDCLWRLAYSFLTLGTVSDLLARTHLPIAGVDQIAALVVGSSFQQCTPTRHMVCREGLTLGALCRILEDKTGIPIQTLDHDRWVQDLRAAVAKTGFEHPFMPMLPWFEENLWQLLAGGEGGEPNVFLDQVHILAAVRRSVEYLIEVGFLPRVVDGVMGFNERRDGFHRRR